jgi:hypothetical protein
MRSNHTNWNNDDSRATTEGCPYNNFKSLCRGGSPCPPNNRDESSYFSGIKLQEG